jgi:hypothetical protein
MRGSRARVSAEVTHRIARQLLAAPGFFLVALLLSGCQSAGVVALDLQGYPNINVLPQAAAPPLTPEDEYRMLSELNAALAAQPQMSAAEQAAFMARQQRLAELARINGIATTQQIIDGN